MCPQKTHRFHNDDTCFVPDQSEGMYLCITSLLARQCACMQTDSESS